MNDTCDERPALSESGPSRLEWGLAFVLFIVPFMSFLYADPTAFLLYELRFAQAILHGNLREAYEPVVNVLSANGWSISTRSVYDLPLNLVFGVWGIPLYLWCSRGGTLEMTYPESFPQMLYAKSAMLAAFLFSAVLVYKICRQVKIDSKRLGWGAYIYFTSSIATSAIGIVGQCDIFCVCLTLLGVLAYLRGENKKFLLWFIIAVQFKQFALFIFVPLMLLRDKNLLRDAGRVLLIMAVTFLCNLPLLTMHEASFARARFTAGMLKKLLSQAIPMFHGDTSLFVAAFGALCVYCWLHRYKDESDTREVHTQTVFTAMLAMIILFTTFPSYPYWYVHMIPYLAVMAMIYPGRTGSILLFETLAMGALVLVNYMRYFWCYTPNNSVNMFLYVLIHGKIPAVNIPEAVQPLQFLPDAGILSKIELKVRGSAKAKGVLDAVWIVCIYTMAWLSRPCAHKDDGRHENIRSFVMWRLVFNTLICSIPIIFAVIYALRS